MSRYGDVDKTKAGGGGSTEGDGMDGCYATGRMRARGSRGQDKGHPVSKENAGLLLK
jgi:hypothetical protein